MIRLPGPVLKHQQSYVNAKFQVAGLEIVRWTRYDIVCECTTTRLWKFYRSLQQWRHLENFSEYSNSIKYHCRIIIHESRGCWETRMNWWTTQSDTSSDDCIILSACCLLPPQKQRLHDTVNDSSKYIKIHTRSIADELGGEMKQRSTSEVEKR